MLNFELKKTTGQYEHHGIIQINCQLCITTHIDSCMFSEYMKIYMRMDKHRCHKPASFTERTENGVWKIVSLNCVYIALIFKKKKVLKHI